MNVEWISLELPSDFHMVSVDVIDFLWMFYDLSMNSRWTSYGLLMDFVWISYGFFMDSYGFPLDFL